MTVHSSIRNLCLKIFRQERLSCGVHDVPLYFLHIPKTAGTSIRRVLIDTYGDRFCQAGVWDDFYRFKDIRSVPYQAYSGHFGLDLSRFLGRPLRTFTLLRDPVERTVSHYLQVRRNVAHPMYTRVLGQTLRDFVFDIDTVPMVWNFQARYLVPIQQTIDELAAIMVPYRNGNFTLAVAWENASAYMDKSKLEDEAMRALHSLAFVGVTDSFDIALNALCTMIDVPNMPAPRENVSPRTEEPLIVEPDVEERIRLLTSVDAALYAAAKAMSGTARRAVKPDLTARYSHGEQTAPIAAA